MLKKRSLYALLFTIALIDGVILYTLATDAAIPRLAIWPIKESNEQSDFYWSPDNHPEGFYFEQPTHKLDSLRQEMDKVIDPGDDQLSKILNIADHVYKIALASSDDGGKLRWDSAEAVVRQINEGRGGAHCFHFSIMFSAYLSSVGVKNRLWSLEGSNTFLSYQRHSIVEVFLEDKQKWILVDAFWGAYFTPPNDDVPYSVFELRDDMLNVNQDKAVIRRLSGEVYTDSAFRAKYHEILPSVFLRYGNDFINKYNPKLRYGFLAPFSGILDKLNNESRRALDYLLGRRDTYLHYLDIHQESIGLRILYAKSAFYFLLLSPLLMLLAVVFSRKQSKD